MAEHAKRLATWRDLEALPDDVRAEIVGGQVHLLPPARMAHGRAQSGVGGEVGGPFDRDPDGPGGWWTVTEPTVELTLHDIVSPDVGGWRRERMPELPEGRVQPAPDWVCEILSPRTAAYDRGSKAALYAAHGVGHLWLVDVDARFLEAFALEQGRWVRLGAWSDEDEPRVPPFEALAFPVTRLFPPARPSGEP